MKYSEVPANRGRDMEPLPRRAGVQCRPVSNSRDLATFIRLPRMIYRGLSGFVAPLDYAERQALDPGRAPFFRHGTAQYWIAWRDGKPLGRISAQIDHLQSEPYGFFGCLDAADDEEAVLRLLGSAQAWLLERGRTIIRGPFSLSINGACGLMTEGQSAGPMVLMPWHPPYLADHVVRAGFAPAKELLCYGLNLRGENAASLCARVKIPNPSPSLRVRGLDLGNLESEAGIISRLYNDAWHDNWGFVPISTEEILTLARNFRMFLVPECCAIVEAAGVPIAVSLILPNISALTGDFGGRLMPFNWLRLFSRASRRQYRSGRLVLLGVSASVRGTVLGSLAPFVMLGAFAQHAERFQLDELELSWILDDNRNVQSIIGRFGGKITKRYKLFQKDAGPRAT
jgi:hypothetical protein